MRHKDYVGKDACVLYLSTSGAELVYNGTVKAIADTHVVLEQKLGSAKKVIELDRVKRITV